MLRPDTFALTVVLGLLTAVGPLSVDMYLPSLPEIGRKLTASPAQVQLTISFYLVGFAVGQIVYGPLSDRHGRKPILLAALALFSAAGLACAFACRSSFLSSLGSFRHSAERERSFSPAPSCVTSIPKHARGANSR